MRQNRVGVTNSTRGNKLGKLAGNMEQRGNWKTKGKRLGTGKLG